MTEPQQCPETRRLRELLAGSLPAPEQNTISRHVDRCPACQETLEELAGSSWEHQVQQLGQEDAKPAPALRQVMEEAVGLRAAQQTQAPGVKGGAADLDYLQPSAKPGHLGRLDHYEILEVAGIGGMGIVLKGFDEKLHRVVAIKVMAPELAASGAARQRFIREARAAAAVSHEHIVAIYAVDENHRPPYLVMQFVEGSSLEDKLKEKGSLGLKEILRIGMQTAAGLAAAHKQGLIHRDIKPANILLENGVERVKITDFGLARAADDASITQSGVVAGTPMYMSPEQADGLPIDYRSDLFSLGSVLYEMCTGDPPFCASGTYALLKRVIEAAPRPIREINNEIPDWLAEIVSKLHARNPEERFQSAQEVVQVLCQHLAEMQSPGKPGRGAGDPPAQVGEPLAPRPGAGKPPRRWLKVRWPSAAVVLLLAVVTAAVLLWPPKGPDHRPKDGPAAGEKPPAPSPSVKKLIWEADFTDPKHQPFGPENISWLRSGYRNGHYFMKTSGAKWYGLPAVTDFACEAELRFLDNPAGAWAIHLRDGFSVNSTAVQIGIDGNAQVFVQPWHYSGKSSEDVAWARSLSHPAINGLGKFNKLSFVVKKDTVQFTVNGTRIDPPVTAGFDLTPCMLGFQALGFPEMHAEFKSLKIWQLRGDFEDILKQEPTDTAGWRDYFWAAWKKRHWDSVVKAANELDNVGAASADVLWVRGLVYASQGKLDLARSDWKLVLAKYPTDEERCYTYAPLLVLLNDNKAYKELCQKIKAIALEKTKGVPTPDQVRLRYICVRIFTADATSTTDWKWLTEMIEHAVVFNKYWHPLLNAQGMVYLRAKKFDEAIASFQKCLAAKPVWHANVLNWLGLALASHHKGNHKEAKKWFSTAQNWLDKIEPTLPTIKDDNPFPTHPQEWLLALVLRREAEQLLK